ncbi:hypothetical protein GCM10010965_21860 [Caldalkalibacillus thermarum]|uniref:polyprenyl synthetase family protein n=1 Tax=Caldalkalibacillus thermarum TaxID=296745 RepID=UPI0016676094|nr:polyprenyl synthetase family protein [Caldalkalibacillus thermarum]GGK28662.1 hypothetical protein GCM10010965_21860 [Caldalkalibacillus thermarum]
MKEMELIFNKMITSIETDLSVPSLKNMALEALKYHQSQSNFSFGRLTLIHHDMFAKRSKEVVKAAAAVEILVLAGDILDDVEDQDQPEAPWTQTELLYSLHLAISLLLLGQKMITDLKIEEERKVKLLSYVSSKLLNSLSGQHIDLTHAIETEEDLLYMIKRKSGSLICLACMLGAILADAEEHFSIIENYALNMGIVAQIKNDLQDLYDWDRKSDIRLKKISLPVWYMLNDKTDNLLKSYYSGQLDYRELYEKKETVIQEVEHKGAIHYARVMIEIHKGKAYQYIEKLNVSAKYKSLLKKLI